MELGTGSLYFRILELSSFLNYTPLNSETLFALSDVVNFLGVCENSLSISILLVSKFMYYDSFVTHKTIFIPSPHCLSADVVVIISLIGNTTRASCTGLYNSIEAVRVVCVFRAILALLSQSKYEAMLAC